MMRTKLGMRVAGVVAAGLLAALLAGCRVESDKHGDSDNVKISTPFGGMQVKTNDAVAVEGIGLPTYPGAQLVKKDKDNGAADVNVNFGSFQLRVKAVSYRTSDSPKKVEAFYREGMKRFGDVIACRDNRAVGKPVRTLEGLTCDNDKQNSYSVDDHPAEGQLQLKAGSNQHQHIVEIDAESGGTKIGLVALDLPGNNNSASGDDQDQQ
jgi:hypothetical protein